MTVLDTNVVGIVLPTIARDLGASFAEIGWVISTYVLCFASLLFPAGSIAHRFGRLIGIGIFAVASLVCGSIGESALPGACVSRRGRRLPARPQVNCLARAADRTPGTNGELDRHFSFVLSPPPSARSSRHFPRRDPAAVSNCSICQALMSMRKKHHR
jgi:MFS family permease